MKSKIFFLSFILCLCSTNSARILGIVPIQARSHFFFHEALFRTLVTAGHEVTLINPYSLNNPVENFTIIQTPVDEAEDENPFSIIAFKNTDIFTMYMRVFELSIKNCENVMRMPFIQNLLKSPKKQFDVIFIEQFFIYECFLPIAEKVDVPVIGTLSASSIFVIDDYYGNPRNPAVQPSEVFNFGMKMTFYERLQNVFQYIMDIYLRETIKAKLKTFFEKYHPTFNPANCRKFSLIFLNDNPSFLPKPVVPSIIHVGGIHVEKGAKQQIPEDIRKFIDEAKHGVILFSLGSIVNSPALDEKIRAAIREAFAEIPQRVIWKFDERIPRLSDNVLVSKWLPQREILAHPKVVLFMSHCGLMSTYEAIYYEKPMVLMPIFADQPATAARLLELEVGNLIDISSVTKEGLVKLINEMTNNPKYGENMRKLSATVKDLPMTPSESIVYWTNYVLRHNGAAHLRTVGADMPFYQYLLLDVIGIVVTIVIALIIILIYSLKKLRQLFRSYKVKANVNAIKKKQ